MKCTKCGSKMDYINLEEDSAMGTGFHMGCVYTCKKCGYEIISE